MISPDRLWWSLMDLAGIGAYDDEHTGLRGVNRLALTDADAAPVSTGSHIESVATAGAFDGCLGGIEAVRTLARHAELTLGTRRRSAPSPSGRTARCWTGPGFPVSSSAPTARAPTRTPSTSTSPRSTASPTS